MIRWWFADLSVSAFTPIYSTLVKPHREYAMQACSSAFSKQASPPWRLHSRIKSVFWRIRSGVLPLFLFRQCGYAWGVKVLQGPSRRLRRKPSISVRVVKYWNRLPTSIVSTPSVNSFKRQLDLAWGELLAEVPWFTVSLSPPQLYYTLFMSFHRTGNNSNFHRIW